MSEHSDQLIRTLDRANRVVVILDRRGRIDHVNEAAAELLGWRRDELLGRDWFDTCLPEAVRNEVRGGFNLLVSGDLEPLEFYDNEVIRRDGSTVSVQWHNVLLREGGRVVGSLSLGQAADALTWADQPLERADAARASRYERLFDAAATGLVVLDDAGTVQLANAAAGSLLAQLAEDLQGVSLRSLLSLRGDGEALDRLLAASPVAVEQLALRRADGSVLWARCEVRQGEDPDGAPELRLSMADVGEERRQRAALVQLASELVGANRELDEFAGVVSHDLKGPLQALVGRLQLVEALAGDQLDERVLKQLALAEEAALRMGQMVDRLLHQARHGTDGRRADLGQVLSAAEQDLYLMLDQAGAEVVRGELPEVRGRPERLVQVFRNLLDNAIKYRSDRPLRIRVASEERAGRWEVVFSDNGRGFAPDQAEAIFGLRHRLGEHADIEGEGVGLALVRSLVELEGGSIVAEGEAGVGARFVLTLPA